MGTEFLVTSTFDKSYKTLKKKYPSIPSDVEQFKKDFSENHTLGDDLGGGYRKVRMAAVRLPNGIGIRRLQKIILTELSGE
ncbi:hypothetical protein AGMMS49965_00820 [Bacteroidia bacterium]|nr:hypothetical protein AGMMS49965_00820 [Bacteroidia bacterium]